MFFYRPKKLKKRKKVDRLILFFFFFKCLKYIHINRNYSTKKEIYKLIDEKVGDNGTRLNLGNINLGDIGAKLLADEFSEKLKKLTYLDLGLCNIGEEGIKSITKELYHFESLWYLNLSINKFGSNGGIALANILSKLTSLTTLYLQGNNLGPYESIAIVNEAKHLNQLSFISFYNNTIGDEGAKAIVDILPNRNGKEKIGVNLSYNNLSSDVVKEIQKKGEEKNLGIYDITDSSSNATPSLPTISYINSYSIRMYQHLTNSPIIIPSLVNLSLRVIDDSNIAIPKFCTQPVQDAIDREVWAGYSFESILEDEDEVMGATQPVF